ncbi:MAG: hypothetical protein JNM66_04660 [Bryobacterales bacterium]|nr:hypothetical protein [Bryobacterales bacterium]
MRESSLLLEEELKVWGQWAASAVKDEADWETDAPNWPKILRLAKDVLVEPDLQVEELALLEAVFSLSEEGECLADFLKERFAEVSTYTIRRLVLSPNPKVRWQVYDSIMDRDEFCVGLLERGLQDTVAYVRRRAFFRLLSHGNPREEILKRAANDVDEVLSGHAREALSRK